MAREYAPIKLAIWADDDFRALSMPAQHLYFLLLTSPTLSHCGVADWRPNRIAALSGHTAEEDIQAAAGELIEHLFILVDESTEEVLVRSYIRHDGLMKQPKMAAAMATAHAAVASTVLRGVLVHELNRLKEDYPDIKGWGSEKACQVLGKGTVNPSTYPLGNGSIKGIGKGNPNPTVKGSPTPVPKPVPTTKEQREGLPDAEVLSLAIQEPPKTARKKAAHRLPDDWKPNGTHREHATKSGLGLDGEVFKFRNHAKSTDRTQVDWNASFSNWLARALDYRTPRQAAASGPFAVWAEE